MDGPRQKWRAARRREGKQGEGRARPPARRAGPRKDDARPGTKAGAGESGSGGPEADYWPKMVLAWASHPVMGPGMMPNTTTAAVQSTSASSVPQLRSSGCTVSGTGRMNM